MTAPTYVVYTMVAPKWRAWGRPVPGLGSRRLLRWQVVRETRKPQPVFGIRTWSYAHVSCHWTRRAADRARRRIAEGGDTDGQ